MLPKNLHPTSVRHLFPCGLVALAYTVLFAAPAAEATVNLVANPSFEEVEAGNLVSWPRTLSTANRDSSVARSGSASLRLGWPAGSPELVEFSTNTGLGEVRANRDYVMRFWVKARGLPGSPENFVRIRYVFLSPNEANVATPDVNAWSYTRREGEWMRVEKRFRTPPNLSQGRLDLNWTLPPGAVAWIDDVSLNEVGAYGSPRELFVDPAVHQFTADGRSVFPVEARLEDDAGNPVKNATGTVHFALRGAGSLVGASSVPLVEGRAQALFLPAPGSESPVTIGVSLAGYGSRSVHLNPIAPSPRSFEAETPVGLFDSGHMVFEGNAFTSMIDDMRSAGRGMDWIMLTNATVDRITPLLDTADRRNVSLFAYPAEDIFSGWYNNDAIALTVEEAKSVARTVVDVWGSHPSMKGVYTIDEPSWDKMEKTRLMNQAFQELRPGWLVAPVLANGSKTPFMFDQTNPNLLLINPYPVRGDTTVGSWFSDFVADIRDRARTRPPGMPMWTILQAHGSANPANSGAAVRRPAPEEIRAQHWLALGEGSSGIFWFIYKTQQWWLGLEDNPALMDEIRSLAARTERFGAILPRLSKIGDEFRAVSEGSAPYSSTLASPYGTIYVIAHNGDPFAARLLELHSARFGGALEDLETGRFYGVGHPIPFRKADGRIFRFHEDIQVEDPGNGFPPGWGRSVREFRSGDVGSVAASGSTEALDNTITVAGSGADISGSIDAFHFYRAPFFGDGEMTVRIDSMEGGNAAWAKAGLMIRAGTGNQDAYGSIFLRSGGTAIFQCREFNGGSTASHYLDATPPSYLRLRWVNGVISGYVSSDGTSWSQVGPDCSPALPATPFGGLAVTSHQDGDVTTASFTDLSIEDDRSAVGPPPPANLRAERQSDGTFRIDWESPEGGAAGFRIYRGTRVVAEVPSPPFVDRDPPGDEPHRYTVVAINAKGGESSAPPALWTRWDPFVEWMEARTGVTGGLPPEEAASEPIDGTGVSWWKAFALGWDSTPGERGPLPEVLPPDGTEALPGLVFSVRSEAIDSFQTFASSDLRDWSSDAEAVRDPVRVGSEGGVERWKVLPGPGLADSDRAFFQLELRRPETDHLTVERRDFNRVVLSWTPPPSGKAATSFQVWRNDLLLATTAERFFSDETVEPQTSYRYEIRSLDPSGEVIGFTERETVLVPAAP